MFLVSYSQVCSRCQSFPHKLDRLLRSREWLAWRFSLKLPMSTWLCLAAVTTRQSTTEVSLNNVYMPKTAWPGVAIIVRWYEDLIYHYIYDKVSLHGCIYSKTRLSRSLVTVMFNITWCTHSNGALAWGFLTDVNTYLISESFRKQWSLV